MARQSATDLATLARWQKIVTVPCPHCGAEAGSQCRYSSGRAKASPHGARRSAAADAKLYVP